MNHESANWRRRASDRDWLVELPIWARVLAVIGIPGAIAIFLVWQGATELPRLSRQQEQLVVDVQRLQQMVSEQGINADSTYRLLQRICVNTAKTDTERQQCFDK
jgi:hypothetical protein